MRPLSLAERKTWLLAHITSRPRLRLTDTVETRGEALFVAITQRNLEGIVGKRLESPYKAGRQPSWVKIKNPKYSRKEPLERPRVNGRTSSPPDHDRRHFDS
jgi:bifunctional non-homologous end joining protein LigD